jgi:hypothetical protein
MQNMTKAEVESNRKLLQADFCSYAQSTPKMVIVKIISKSIKKDCLGGIGRRGKKRVLGVEHN